MISAILVIGYFLLIIFVALAMENSRKKKESDSADYSSGRNTLGYFSTLALMCGNAIGGAYIIGTAYGVFETNLGYNWVFLGYVIGWAVSVFFLPFFRAAGHKTGATSVGESFGAFFSARCNRAMSAIIFLAFAGAMSAAVINIGSILRSLLGLSYWPSIIATIVVILTLALLGGMGGLAHVNVVNITFMIGGSIILAICCCLSTEGGFDAAWQFFSEGGHASFTGSHYAMSSIIPLLIMNAASCYCAPLTVSATVGAKSLKVARCAQMTFPIIALIFIGAVNVCGICAANWGLSASTEVWFDTASRFGPVAAAIASIAVLSAELSSYPAMLLMMGSMAVRDFYLPLSGKDMPEEKKIRITRILMIAFGLFFMILGIFAGDVVNIISNAYTIIAVAGMTLMIFLIWKRPNEKVVFWSLIAGTVVTTIWAVSGIYMSTPLLGIQTQTMAFIVTMIVMVILTLTTTKPGPSENYKMYFAAKTQVLEKERPEVGGVQNG